MDIEQKVNAYKRRFGCPEGLSLRALYDIARELDIVFHHGDFHELKGAYYYFERTKHIILDDKLSEIEEAFVLSHELGHAVLHRTESCFFNRWYAQAHKPRLEMEADKFSALALLPDAIPLDELCYYTLEQLAAIYYVPPELMRIKLNLLGIRSG